MASAELAVQSGVARPALSSQSGRLSSNQTSSSNSLSDIGIVLPSLHLGSFSNMTLGTMPHTPGTSLPSSPGQQQQQRSAPSSPNLVPDARSTKSQQRERLDATSGQRTLSNGSPSYSTTHPRPQPSTSGSSSPASATPLQPPSSSPRLSSYPARSEPSEHEGTMSTAAGGSFSRMLPTPVASTVSSSPNGKIVASPREDQQQQQPISSSPNPNKECSSEEEEGDELDFALSSKTPMGGATGDRSRAAAVADDDDTTGTPQLKVVNGQHATPRRGVLSNVNDLASPTSPGVYDSPSTWTAPHMYPTNPGPNPAAARPTNGGGGGKLSPPPQGAAPPDPSRAFYPSSYQQSTLVADPNTPSTSNPSDAQGYASRPLRPRSQSRPQQQAQAYSPGASGSWQPAYQTPPSTTGKGPSDRNPSSQSPYSSRPKPPPVPTQPQYVQKVIQPEEVCVECMMRDRDMADVDVSSPGVWERESDVWYEELVRREVEEARRGIVPSENSGRPRAKGGALTEANVAVWLTMNPKEPQARWQTLEKYVKAQGELLAAENDAREATLREARTQDSRIRESFQHIRRSVGGAAPSGGAAGEGTYSQVLGVTTIANGAGRASLGAESSSSAKRGVKLRASTTYDDFNAYEQPATVQSPGGYSPYQASPASYGSNAAGGGASAPATVTAAAKRRSRSKDREVTLLESGMIMERVDIHREEREEKERRRAEEREERRRTRKTSRVSTTGIPSSATYGSSGMMATMSDASSMHSLSAPMQSVNYGGSRSQISLIAAPPSIAAAAAGKRMSSPMILTPPRPPMARGTSQSSVESSHRTPRFFGFRHWSGAYGSEASQHGGANTGSMVDMHLGLEQDREMLGGAHEEQNWTISQLVDEPEPESGALEIPERDKRSSIGRFWKKMTGGTKDKDEPRQPRKSTTRRDEDLSVPLDPPPPLSYLVSRSSREPSPQRHASSPSRQSLHMPTGHPRSLSTPANQGTALPPTSPPSISTQFVVPSSPSATTSQTRYSPRDSVASGDDRRYSQYGPHGDAGFVNQFGHPQFLPDEVPYEAQERGSIYTRSGAHDPYSQDPYAQNWTPRARASRTSVQMTPQGSRPLSSASDKDLPPLPDGAKPPQPQTSRSFPVLRPTTSYEVVDLRPDLRPPLAPFKSDQRRQSFSGRVTSMFGGSRSRLNSDAGLAATATYATHAGVPTGYENNHGMYHPDEFGASTPSLGQWGSDDSAAAQQQQLYRAGEIPVAHTTYSIASKSSQKDKRASKSRGLSGRLSAIFRPSGSHHGGHGRESTMPSRPSEEREDYVRTGAARGVGLAPNDGERYARQPTYPSTNGRASRSEVALRDSSASSFVTFPRNSIASSRRYEGVIPQERDFIAMRYPTETERLNLMRQT